jgi:hypothetical protein
MPIRKPIRNIPVSTVVDGVALAGRITVLWPNDMLVVMTAPFPGWGTGLHVPHFAMYPCNWLATYSGERTIAITERGRRRAEDLLKELYAAAQGKGSGCGVYRVRQPRPQAGNGPAKCRQISFTGARRRPRV